MRYYLQIIIVLFISHNHNLHNWKLKNCVKNTPKYALYILKKKKKPKIYITKTLQNAYFKSGAVFRNTQKHFMFDKKVLPK